MVVMDLVIALVYATAGALSVRELTPCKNSEDRDRKTERINRETWNRKANTRPYKGKISGPPPQTERSKAAYAKRENHLASNRRYGNHGFYQPGPSYGV